MEIHNLLDSIWKLYNERHQLELGRSSMDIMEVCMKMLNVEFERLLNTSPEKLLEEQNRLKDTLWKVQR